MLKSLEHRCVSAQSAYMYLCHRMDEQVDEWMDGWTALHHTCKHYQSQLTPRDLLHAGLEHSVHNSLRDQATAAAEINKLCPLIYTWMERWMMDG